jgi:hypothetical protein
MLQQSKARSQPQSLLPAEPPLSHFSLCHRQIALILDTEPSFCLVETTIQVDNGPAVLTVAAVFSCNIEPEETEAAESGGIQVGALWANGNADCGSL